MASSATLESVLDLALQLSPTERLELIEQVASSVGRDLSVQKPATEHWGKSLIALLEALPPIDLLYPEIDDPVKWVRQIRSD